MRSASVAAAAAAICMALVTAPIAGQDASPGWSPSPSPTIGLPADNGARIVMVETLDSRTRDLTIESPTVGNAQVRLLLPAGFEEGMDGRLPVLYLLHGGGGGYTDWTKNTDVAAHTVATGLLVVMPAAATSMVGTGAVEGGPDGVVGLDWERFHLTELRQLLERNWHAGTERAIAGLSLGGYAAVMYAARHPHLFDAVASYSGALDLAVAPGESEAAAQLIEHATQIAKAAGWPEANPINLVSTLRFTAPYISYGDGEPGPLDPEDSAFDHLEAWIGKGGDNFVAGLEEDGIAATVNAYGPGTHSWPYWDRELAASMPMLLEALGESSIPPTTSPTP